VYDPYDDPWSNYPCPPVRPKSDLVTHLVFVGGRLAESWSEEAAESKYAEFARSLAAERRTQIVQPPPPRPRHLQVLEWLDSLVGGREAVLALGTVPETKPMLRDVVDPVADEPWLIADELLDDVCSSLLPADLAAPMRRCLLLLRERCPALPARLTPDRIAAGIVWVVGKSNGAIGPDGPVTQLSIAAQLGVDSLNSCGNRVLGHVNRLGWATPRPWGSNCPPLLATGRTELLSARTVADLVELRDQALNQQSGVLPFEVES